MKSPWDFACTHCHAAVGEPCRSVGGRVIVVPHMRRLDASVGLHMQLPNVQGTREQWARVASDLYETKVLISVFGHFTEDIRQRARKDRSIDPTKPWVLRAIGQHKQRDTSDTTDAAQGALFS